MSYEAEKCIKIRVSPWAGMRCPFGEFGIVHSCLHLLREREKPRAVPFAGMQLLRWSGEKLLHQTPLVGLEGFELGALGGDQVVEGGEAGGDALLFCEGGNDRCRKLFLKTSTTRAAPYRPVPFGESRQPQAVRKSSFPSHAEITQPKPIWGLL